MHLDKITVEKDEYSNDILSKQIIKHNNRLVQTGCLFTLFLIPTLFFVTLYVLRYINSDRVNCFKINELSDYQTMYENA